MEHEPLGNQCEWVAIGDIQPWAKRNGAPTFRTPTVATVPGGRELLQRCNTYRGGRCRAESASDENRLPGKREGCGRSCAESGRSAGGGSRKVHSPWTEAPGKWDKGGRQFPESGTKVDADSRKVEESWTEVPGKWEFWGKKGPSDSPDAMCDRGLTVDLPKLHELTAARGDVVATDVRVAPARQPGSIPDASEIRRAMGPGNRLADGPPIQRRFNKGESVLRSRRRLLAGRFRGVSQTGKRGPGTGSGRSEVHPNGQPLESGRCGFQPVQGERWVRP